MAAFQTWLCVWAVVVLALGSEASVIHFHAYPPVLKDNLTESASMRCSLADTEAGSHIGRSVTSTTVDILHISSIHVTHGDLEVASITPFDPATVAGDGGNLEVKGDVSGGGSAGYLELSWKNAADIALGEYECEIVTINSQHQNVQFSSTLELTSVAPTIQDVIQAFNSRLKSQEQKIEAQDQKIHKLQECTSHSVDFMAVLSTFPLASGTEYEIGVNKPLVFDKVIYSMGGGYDASSGVFTCPESGVYFFSAHIVSYFKENACIHLKINNQIVTSLHAYDTVTIDTGSTSVLVHLKTHDTVHFVTSPGCTAELFSDGNVPQANVFTGHMTRSDTCVV